MSSFGSHINENIIGRIRVTCHGDPRFTVIMRSIAKAELRRIHQAELGVEHCIRGRDNVGGTKLNPDITEVMEGIDFTAAAKGLLKALDFNAGDVAQVELDKIVEFLVGVVDRKDQIYPYINLTILQTLESWRDLCISNPMYSPKLNITTHHLLNNYKTQKISKSLKSTYAQEPPFK